MRHGKTSVWRSSTLTEACGKADGDFHLASSPEMSSFVIINEVVQGGSPAALTGCAGSRAVKLGIASVL
jgi:hypothetical protein